MCTPKGVVPRHKVQYSMHQLQTMFAANAMAVLGDEFESSIQCRVPYRLRSSDDRLPFCAKTPMHTYAVAYNCLRDSHLCRSSIVDNSSKAQWTEGMGIHLFILCHTFGVGPSFDNPDVMLFGLIPANSKPTSVMVQVRELLIGSRSHSVEAGLACITSCTSSFFCRLRGTAPRT